MNIKTYYIFILSLLIFAACSKDVYLKIDERTLAKISLCSGGYGVSLKKDLELSILSNIDQGLNASTGFEEELKGYYLENAEVEGSDAVYLYQSYVNCLNNENSTDEIVSVLNSRRDDIIDTLVEFEKEHYVDKFVKMHDKLIIYTRNNFRLAAWDEGNRIRQYLQTVEKEINTLNEMITSEETTTSDKIGIINEMIGPLERDQRDSEVQFMYSDEDEIVDVTYQAALEERRIREAAEMEEKRKRELALIGNYHNKKAIKSTEIECIFAKETEFYYERNCR